MYQYVKDRLVVVRRCKIRHKKNAFQSLETHSETKAESMCRKQKDNGLDFLHVRNYSRKFLRNSIRTTSRGEAPISRHLSICKRI